MTICGYQILPTISDNGWQLISSLTGAIIGALIAYIFTEKANKNARIQVEKNKNLEDATYVMLFCTMVCNDLIRMCQAYENQFSEEIDGNFRYLSQRVMPLAGRRKSYEVDFSKLHFMLSADDKEPLNDFLQLVNLCNHISGLSEDYREAWKIATDKIREARITSIVGEKITTEANDEKEVFNFVPDFIKADAILEGIKNAVPSAQSLARKTSEQIGHDIKRILKDERFTASFSLVENAKTN